MVQLRADQDGFGQLFDAVGIVAYLAYAPDDRFATNQTITVTYTEPNGTTEAVVFTAKASPSGSAQFYNAGFSGTNTEYWVFIRNLIAAHPRIAPFLDVFLTLSGGDKINFRLKNTDADWDLEVTNTGGFTVTSDAATVDATPVNYKVRLEMFFEHTYMAGDYTVAAQLEGIPEAGTGSVFFDVAGILSAECRASRFEPLVPQFGNDTPFLADNFRRWYFRFTEEYGAPVVVQDWLYSVADKLAYDGGVSQAMFAEGDFFDTLNSDNAFLTWAPDGKRVSLEQPEYLAWHNYSNTTQSVFVRVVWYDIETGAESSPTSYFSPGLSVRPGETGIFPVWPALFGLDTEETAYKYTVEVGVSSISFSPMSQKRTYYIDRDYYESERNLMYLNGFGCPETWRCTGNMSKRLRVQRQSSEKTLLPDYNLLASERFQYARQFDVEITYRTGYITKVEADALQELLISGEVYDVSASGYIPLLITSGDFRITETRQELHSYEFTAQVRMDMRNYSRKQLATIGSDAWLDESGEPWWDEVTVPWQNE